MKIRSNFSVPHLLAAAHFSRQVCSIEIGNQGKPLGPFYDDILAFSIANVMTAVASLESYINEVFFDYRKNFSSDKETLIKNIWKHFAERPTMEKFDLALMLRDRAVFDKATNPYQDVAILIKLRNSLVHFSPEWEDEQVAHERLSAQLSGKFQPSPFMQGSAPLFPKRWATSGCTKWAIASCLSYVQHFEELSGLEHRFDNFLDRLSGE